MSTVTRPLSNRAVHLRITPRPSNLGESREIMRLISQFGPVEYYRNLKYDTGGPGGGLSTPNAAIVIFRTEEAAVECLRRSPVRFRMGRVKQGRSRKEIGAGEVEKDGGEQVEEKTFPGERRTRGRVGTPFGLGAAGQTRRLSTSALEELPTPPPNAIRMPFDSPSSSEDTPQDDSRLFQIQTNPSHRNFRDQINTSHYHGSFAIDTKAPGQEDIANKVPKGMLGLSCVSWNGSRGAMERPWRVVEAEKRKFGGRKSLGRIWREAQGMDGGAASEMDDGEEANVEMSAVSEDIGSFAVGVGTSESGTTEVKAEASKNDDPLSNTASGWDEFLSEISSGEGAIERYSRRRKG